MKIVAMEDKFAIAEGLQPDLLVAKEKCGFAFDPVTGLLTGVAANIDALRNHKLLLKEKLMITKKAADMYVAAGYVKQDAVALSHAKSSDVVIPAPEGLKYLLFQKAGIEYALEVFRRNKRN